MGESMTAQEPSGPHTGDEGSGERQSPSVERCATERNVEETLVELLLTAQALEVAQAGPHVGIWLGQGDQLRACLRRHEHGGDDNDPGPECRVWVTEDFSVRHLR